MVTGAFTNFNGVTRHRIVRLLENGAVDASFDPGSGANDTILAMHLDRFGRIYIGGEFTRYRGRLQVGIARIHGDVFGVEPRLAFGAFSVQVMTAGGWTYHLERSPSLQPLSWSEVDQVVGNGLPQALRDEGSGDGSFYRIRVE